MAAELATALEAIWERSRPALAAQIETLEEAVVAVERDGLDDELRGRGERDAHRLAGSLGTFGLANGSDLAREVEEMLAGGHDDDQGRLASLVASIVAEVEGRRSGPLQEGGAVVPCPAAAQGTVLAIDDDPAISAALSALLEPHGLAVVTLNDPRGLFEALRETSPDLLILDFDMPGVGGLELCRAIREAPAHAELPVMFLTARRDAPSVQAIFEAGADDYVSKPIVGFELTTRIRNRLERVRLYRQLAETDPLTGLSNRRSAIKAIERLLAMCSRVGVPVAIAVLDIDHFKRVNDRFGHAIGDAVLCRLADVLRRELREEDVIARWGGEEFLIAMYATGREDGARRIERLLAIFGHEQLLPRHCGEIAGLSFSAGVAQGPRDGVELESLYRVADAAMYSAKAAGRARVLT